jgi:hypothetical protein
MIVAVVLGLSLRVAAQSSQPSPPEVKSFELTATPPPVPALKYELFYEVLSERVPATPPFCTCRQR